MRSARVAVSIINALGIGFLGQTLLYLGHTKHDHKERHYIERANRILWHRDEFELISLGTVPIRGKNEPVEIWSVKGKV